MSRGKTIEIFLPDGNSRSIKIIHERNSICKSFFIPRSRFKEILQRNELEGVGIYFLFGFYQKMNDTKSKPVSPLARGRQLPDGPRLQVDPGLDWVIFNAKQDSILNSYGWISKEAGVVRVPIEKAMAVSLERGFPVRPARQENKQ